MHRERGESTYLILADGVLAAAVLKLPTDVVGVGADRALRVALQVRIRVEEHLRNKRDTGVAMVWIRRHEDR